MNVVVYVVVLLDKVKCQADVCCVEIKVVRLWRKGREALCRAANVSDGGERQRRATAGESGG